MEPVKDLVRQFVLKIAQRRGIQTVPDDESLTGAGVLTSLGIFRLVAFVEGTFSVSIDDEDITDENFHSINTIERMIACKLHQD